MAALGVGDARTLRPQWYAYAPAKRRARYKFFFHTPIFLSFLSSFTSHLPVHNFFSSLSFHQLITINHDLYL